MGIVFALVGIFFLIYTIISPQLTFGSTTSDGVPGAGFFPYILSALLIILGVVLVIRSQSKEIKPYVEMTDEVRGNLRTMLIMLAGFVVFLLVWKLLSGFIGNWGFLACVFVFEIFINKLFQRSWKFTLIYAAVLTVFIYLVFNLAFKITFTA